MPSRLLRLLASALCGTIVAAGAPRPALATVLVAADLSELVTSARAIVHGRVVAAVPQWLEGRRGIETLVTLEVEDSLKGGASREVTFRVPGGQMGPYRSLMPGAPSFSEGDDIIVFLGGTGPAIPHLVGFSQGVYRVLDDDEIGRTVSAGVPLATSASAARRPVPLATFEARVRTLVQSGGAQ